MTYLVHIYDRNEGGSLLLCHPPLMLKVCHKCGHVTRVELSLPARQILPFLPTFSHKNRFL